MNGDADDWAVTRMVELRQAGEQATFRIEWTVVRGTRIYTIAIRRQDGRIERAADWLHREEAMNSAWIEEQLLRNAALKYARAAFQPEEQRRRVKLALEITRRLGEPRKFTKLPSDTSDLLMPVEELDDVLELCRLTLQHAGTRVETVCSETGCPRDGDCPIHGKNRPGQCVTSEPAAGRYQVSGFSSDPDPEPRAESQELLSTAAERARQIKEELEAAVKRKEET